MGVRGARREGGGGGFFIESPKRGVLPGEGGGGPRGREGVCGDFLGGGGLNIFFRGRNSHQVLLSCNHLIGSASSNDLILVCYETLLG